MASLEFLSMPFEKAVKFLSAKTSLPTETTKRMTEEHHRFAFMISGITRGEILDDTKFLLIEALEKGDDFEVFKEKFRQNIEKKGWRPTDSRLAQMFSTNIRRAYGEGRHQQMIDPALIQKRKFRLWRHGNSPEPRPNHLAIDDKAFPSDSSFFDVVKDGACAFGCRCRTFLLNDRDMKRMGLTVSIPPDPNTIAEPGFRGKKVVEWRVSANRYWLMRSVGCHLSCRKK